MIRRSGAFVALLVILVLAASDPNPVAAVKKGDADCSGRVNVTDARFLLQVRAGLADEGDCFDAADLNCDGEVNERDIIVLLIDKAAVSLFPAGCGPAGTAFPATIYFDSGGHDGEVTSAFYSDNGDMIVGDTGGQGLPGARPDKSRRVSIRFPLSQVQGAVGQAKLKLYITESRMDQYPDPGVIDGTAPYSNPGIGDLLVIHVADFGSPGLDDYDSPSLGNDPGVLIANGVEPSAQLIEIDVTAALQQALASGAPTVAFRLQMSMETDNDGLNDTWGFFSGSTTEPQFLPFIEYS